MLAVLDILFFALVLFLACFATGFFESCAVALSAWQSPWLDELMHFFYSTYYYILIGGSGEKVTLKLVAQHADAWNTFGPPEHFAQKNAVLDNWCAELGRDPGEIERTVAVQGDDVADIGRYLDVGATHIIVMCGAPFDLAPLEALIGQRDALG